MSELLLSLCLPDEPSSFRNYLDSKIWRSEILNAHKERLSNELELFHSSAVSFPVSCAVSLRVLHLYAGKQSRRDIDNSAKPIMDAFNTVAYKDDSQVKDLSYISAPLFSTIASSALAQNNGFFGGRLTTLMMRHAGPNKISDVTMIELRDISGELKDTKSDFFLIKNKHGARQIFG